MARILVIDDDPVMRQILRVVLQTEGHEISEAADGNAGIAEYRARPTDLIIADMIMPEKPGWEAILELRREFPDVKAIGISAGGRLGPHGYLMLAKRFGAKRVLMKPIKRTDLLTAVDEVLQGKVGSQDAKRKTIKRSSEKKSVFVLDRDRTHCWSLCEGLTQAGHTVTDTSHPDYALEILRARVFDTAILDAPATSRGGDDLIKMLRSSWTNPRIIVMADFDSLVVKNLVISRGAHHFISKPVDIEDLLDLIVPSAMFKSQLEGFDILEYLQFILMTGKSTVVEVRSREGELSKIYCRGGNMIHAVSGGVSGEAAFFRCVSLRGGSLSNSAWEDPDQQTISKPGDFLLFEAARRRDESK
jgi:DNA-binding response OmpR family regulator